MICSFDEVATIIKTNPNKQLIDIGKKQCQKLMLHVHGKGIDNALVKHDYFESDDIFKERNSCKISNKDMFARILHEEGKVFTATGGMTLYEGLQDPKVLDEKLSKIKYGISLREWVKTFGLDAYRCDPMGVIMIEVDKEGDDCYPTYKCIDSIFDYLPNGRQLEYICFRLTVKDAIDFGVTDELFKNSQGSDLSDYYRFIDDEKDSIYKWKDNIITEYTNENVKPIPNDWQKTPAFVISNLLSFDQSNIFVSPLNYCIELADAYLNDRSMRELQKKYTAFAKTIEPLLECGTCAGTGMLRGAACPDCTPPGADRGTGHKLRTKVSDTARFPIDKDLGDPSRFFAYINMPVETITKQDSALVDLENMIYTVYWGTNNAQIQNNGSGKSPEETATKTVMNLQPKYDRLNKTADWAESTENAMIDFIGAFYADGFKKSLCTYGRFYILESPYELMENYLDMKAKGASQFALTDQLKKYYYSLYQTNPIKLAISLKLINVEPFVHLTISDLQGLNPPKKDYINKLYFNEWLATKDDNFLLTSKEEKLKQDLDTFTQEKQALIEEDAQKKVEKAQQMMKSTQSQTQIQNDSTEND